jgi:multiple sugar transport system substrate-binding protein
LNLLSGFPKRTNNEMQPPNPINSPMIQQPTRTHRQRWLSLLCCSALVSAGTAQAQTTVEIIHYFNSGGQPAALAEIVKDFESANPDIKIKTTFVPFGELVSRTLQMAAVHKPPAISCIDNPDVLRVAKAGILKDISQEVQKLDTWKDVYPGPKAAVTDGAKVYGVPIGSNSLSIFYNKKMFADAGITDPPKTWAELSEDAAKTTKSPVYGIAFSAVNDEQSTWQWEPFLWTNGGSLLDISSDKAKEAMKLWADWVQKGAASHDAVNWGQGDVANQFIGGHAAMMVMGPWMLGEVKKSGLEFGITTIPVPSAGMKPRVGLGGEVWCVLKSDPKTEQAALKFIEFTQQPDRLIKFLTTFNYVSSSQSIAKKQSESQPELQPWIDQMDTARARPEEGGANYPAVSLAARTAIQKVLSGQATVDAALSEAAEKIKSIAEKK